MNRLGNEPSLYLRQHADNPVDWHPWDDDALALARSQDRPILLSIGYSACHWCHVMAHESFEDEETAERMNRLFVNIKVDREERPDLDRVYQLAHQLMTGRGGGWPLTVFLDPTERVPIFAGTYFPRERRYGMPSFGEVLLAVERWYREHRDEMSEQNGTIRDAIRSIQNPGGGDEPPGPEQSAALAAAFARDARARYDAANGGYGGAPKFPQAPLLQAVSDLSRQEDGEVLGTELRHSLRQMAASGLRDHLDGGFFRYCVDGDWTIPHFEKMLYDNAQLLPLYAEGARRWNDSLLESAARGIARWLDAEMKQPDGGYAASIDADADGVEGGYHVWTPQQVEGLLKQPLCEWFCAAHGLDGPPNFEGREWHLQQREPHDALARRFGISEQELESGLEQARAVLAEARRDRTPPAKDDKRLASWNALLADGWIRAGKALGEPAWLERADGIFDFLQRRMWGAEGLAAVYNDGRRQYAAYLDDHAWLLQALLAGLQERWRADRLEFAVQVADRMLEHFEDREGGGFRFSDARVDVPIARPLLFQDDATPAGNAAAASGLDRLGHLLGEPRYNRAAERCLQRALPQIGESPMACASMLPALRRVVEPPLHLVLAGHDPERLAELKKWAEGQDRVDCYLLGPPDDRLPGVLGSYRTEEPATAWLCRGAQCLPPVHTVEDLAGQAENGPTP